MEDDLKLPDKSPFAPLQLTYEEQQHCYDLSQQLLEKTLHSYDERLAGITSRHHSNLESARWKLQKTQANASMYSERIRHIRTDLHLPDDAWQDPTVLMMVGNIPAPLDEIMLGVAVPTFDNFKIRVSALGSQEIGGAQLARLVGPTENKPFQHLSIYYWATRLPWLVNILVKPRDFVLLSASGIITTADGERIGYDLLQPAPLSQCPPLSKPMIQDETNFSLPDQSPFPPLELTFEDQQHCHDLSLQLLEKTLHSYDERLAGVTPRHHSNLDSARWKLQKTQENASLYSERIRHIRTDLHLPDDNWGDPTVLMMVGTIPASLDEVMYGMAVPTFEALQVRISTLGNQEIGGAMLARLVGPTDDKPFQNLSIFYMASRLPWLVSKVVKPRDFVLLAASGIITTSDGERIGYDLLQPAPLPQCPPLPKPMIRGKFMFGALYRQQVDGNVDVYIQQYVESLGNLMESFIISSTWQSLLGFFRSPMLAEHKKLQWCIANMKSARRRGVANELSGYSMNCSQCSAVFARNVRNRSDQRNCVLCLAPVCSSCREEQVYKVLDQHKKGLAIRKKQVFVCRPCLEFVQSQKPANIARYNILNQLTPASNSSGDTNDTGRTWGLLYGDSMPSWSPRRSLSMSSGSFESFGWSADP
ncbi:uncharacterized protein KRP23_7500 [Phytophthora ramorum]|uniref:uncharacterized protein n=1 Tax=Phytophthora ramorum TaxID=164328 RepID=UPI00309B71F3|nr:hypothetical protein KRP23_7500 [Phytophthora ramorum]